MNRDEIKAARLTHTREQLELYAGLRMSLAYEQRGARDWSDTAILLAKDVLSLLDALEVLGTCMKCKGAIHRIQGFIENEGRPYHLSCHQLLMLDAQQERIEKALTDDELKDAIFDTLIIKGEEPRLTRTNHGYSIDWTLILDLQKRLRREEAP